MTDLSKFRTSQLQDAKRTAVDELRELSVLGISASRQTILIDKIKTINEELARREAE